MKQCVGCGASPGDALTGRWPKDQKGSCGTHDEFSCEYGSYCVENEIENFCLDNVHGYGLAPYIYYNGCNATMQQWIFS